MIAPLAISFADIEAAFSGAFREIHSEMDPAKHYERTARIEKDGALIFEWREVPPTPLKPGPKLNKSRWG